MKLRHLTFALTLAFGTALAADPASEQAGKGIAVGETIELRAKVTAIDLAERVVTLQSEDGRSEQLEVDPAVQNLDRLAVGDTVVATYLVALAARIATPGESTPAVQQVVSLPEKGASGPIVAAQQVTARLVVNAVDVAANTVTLTGPRGVTKTVAVRNPEVQARLKSLKAGDEVDVTYTEAVALTLERVAP